MTASTGTHKTPLLAMTGISKRFAAMPVLEDVRFELNAGEDIGAKHEIYELMNRWTARGIAIVLITSEMTELLAMSDRIIVMHRGRVTAEFDAADATQEAVLQAAMGEKIE